MTPSETPQTQSQPQTPTHPDTHRRTTVDATVLAALADLIAEATRHDTSEVVPDALLERDLDLDSLALLEIVIRAEDRFGIVLPDEVPWLVTVGDVVTHIAEVLTEAASLPRAG